jgi:transposase InsO family protein
MHSLSDTDTPRRLLYLNGSLHGKPALFMIDSGASNNFVSPAFVKLAQLQPVPSSRRISLADPSVVKPALGSVAASASLVACERGGKQRLVFETNYTATELGPQDVILGMPWLEQHNPTIDWSRRRLVVTTPSGDKFSFQALSDAEMEPIRQRAATAAAQVKRAATAAAPVARAASAAAPVVVSTISTSELDALVSQGEVATAYLCFIHPVAAAESSVASLSSATVAGGSSSVVAAGPSPSAEQLAALQVKLLAEYRDVFPDKLPPGLPPVRGGVEHTIELLPDSKPPNRATYRQSAAELEELKKQLDEMLEQGFIRPSQSPFGAPVIFVKKKDGTLRLCVDYRALNSITVRNVYPLPLLDEMFDRLQGAKYFSKIDLRTGFYQIPIAERDVHKTAFRSRFGLYEYRVLPMGLTNAPATFMHLMNKTFADYIDKFVQTFLDDILIYSTTLSDHEQHVRHVLDRLRKEKLYAKASKCEFFRHEVEFLGHRVSADGISVCADKVQSVREWPALSKVADVRSFLGLCGFYRRFVKGFSTIALPLTNLLKNDAAFVWGPEQQQAFDALKQALTSAPLLAVADPKLPYRLDVDASDYAIGGVLQQDQGNGLQPVAFYSRKLKAAELNYEVHDKEMLGVILSLKHWRAYVHNNQTLAIKTDHDTLKSFMTQERLTGRKGRWQEVVAEYKMHITHVPGRENVVPDALSRRPDYRPSEGKYPESAQPVAASARADDLLEQQQRARNRAAARETHPPAADRPPPNKKGVIVMPTQRCAATTKKGEHCRQLTARGQYCWSHLRSVEKLRIKKSLVPRAGMGLFADRDYHVGEHIADYTGDRICNNRDTGPYFLQLSGKCAIDAARTNAGSGRWCNDPRGSDYRANAKFCANHRDRTACIRADRPIRKGDEILVPYGADYWRYFGQQFKRAWVRKSMPAAAVSSITDEQSESARLMGVVASASSDLADEIKAAAAADPDYQYRLNREHSPNEPIQRRGDLLYYIADNKQDRVCLPESLELRTRMIAECHDAAGHQGKDKTVERVKQRFHWKGMDQQIDNYVTTCDECQRNKPSQRPPMGLLMPLPVPEQPGIDWSMDMIMPLPLTRAGNSCIVTFVDRGSKLVHLAACKHTVTAKQLAEITLREVVQHHGVPRSIVSDRGTQFTSKYWQELWKQFGSSLNMSTAYHPQTDGQSENMNKQVETMLRSRVNFDQDDWDEQLPLIVLAINSSKHASTQYSPAYLPYGRELQQPLDIALAPLRDIDNPSVQQRVERGLAAWNKARDSMLKAQQRQAHYANQHRSDVKLKAGDRVLLSVEHLQFIGAGSRTPKLAGKYIGPFVVKKAINDNAYTLELPDQLRLLYDTFNISRLRPYKDGSVLFPDRPQPHDRPPPEISHSDNGAPAWEVERIVAKRGRGGATRWLVLWRGYPLEEATWEPRASLTGAEEALAEFESLH